MICLLKLLPPDQVSWPGSDAADVVDGWFIGADVDDARRYADVNGHQDLAADLYRAPYPLSPGKYRLPSGFLLLVT